MPTYQKFNDRAAAVALAERFGDAGIPAVVDDTSGLVAAEFSRNALLDEFRVRIRKEDFEKADALMRADAEQALAELPEDHYLFSFSENELREVLEKPDEWNVMDRVLARKLLAEKGVRITEDELADIQNARLDTLSEPERIKGYWIALGYASAALGGVLGFLVGLGLATSKKTLPNGEQVYAWAREDRQHGQVMVMLGALMMLFLVLRFFL